jgi:hypothetical protein
MTEWLLCLGLGVMILPGLLMVLAYFEERILRGR